jgi:hypothetical protein
MNSQRVFTALLRLYPRRFREEYGDEMRALFSELQAHRAGSGVAFWAFVLADTLWAAARERLEGTRWLATAACGLLVTAIVGDATAWAYRYFYHPYFEGITIRLLPYGLGLGVVLGVSVALAQRLLYPSSERRARQWMLASAIALPIVVLFCSAAIDRAATGVLPIAAVQPSLRDMFVLGLAQPKSWSDLATQFGAMAASALVARALLVAPFLRSRHAH